MCAQMMVAKGYMSGGSGYALSRAAVEAAVVRGFANASLCSNGSTGDEDVLMGQ